MENGCQGRESRQLTRAGGKEKTRMPSNKCPICGYRNNQFAHTCANCDESLDGSVEPSPQTPPVRVVDERRRRVVDEPAPEQEPKKALIPNAFVRQMRDGASPYQRAIQDQTLDLFPSEGFVTFLSTPPQQTPGQELPTHLPLKYAWSKPKLVGKITHLESREQINDSPNIFGAVLAILAEIIWVLPNVQSSRDPIDKIEITRLRILSADEQIHDATVRGSLRGANLSMGDYVSLWGHRRKGNLLVSKGYDHTSRSPISTTATGMLLPALLLVVIAAVLSLSMFHFSLVDALNALKTFVSGFQKR